MGDKVPTLLDPLVEWFEEGKTRAHNLPSGNKRRKKENAAS